MSLPKPLKRLLVAKYTQAMSSIKKLLEGMLQGMAPARLVALVSQKVRELLVPPPTAAVGGGGGGGREGGGGGGARARA